MSRPHRRLVYRASEGILFLGLQCGVWVILYGMAGLILSPEDRAHFLVLMRRQLNSAVHRRMNGLLLLDDGWSVARIAAALHLDAGTVAEHRALYLEQGRAGVESLAYAGRVSRLSADQRAALSDWIAAEVPQTAQAVCAWVQATFAVSYAAHAMARLLGPNHPRSSGDRQWLTVPIARAGERCSLA